MRTYRQSQWHGIQFQSFLKTRAFSFANSEFYDQFYSEFYRRYVTWAFLDPKWLKEKTRLAHFISSRVSGVEEPSILSIGCGIGAIERELIKYCKKLEVTEVTSTPLRWLKQENPELATYIGFFPEAVPVENRYSMIYLSAVEYCFDRSSLVRLISSMLPYLMPNGHCLIISASCEPDTPSWITRTVRETLQIVAMALRLRPGQQLWGFMRTATEIIETVQSAGFEVVESGWIDSKLYWVEGRKASAQVGKVI
ncbi:MAG: hypothetical protein EOP04_11710 [Proteobacteria bacterium]|nr:MAG: hypothetical protein EOP04_11710 [Pseudomonadota bacterium]